MKIKSLPQLLIMFIFMMVHFVAFAFAEYLVLPLFYAILLIALSVEYLILKRLQQ